MQSLNEQIRDFMLCALVGIPIGFFHDFLYFKRILKRKKKEMLFAIFCIVSTIIVISCLYMINYYNIKWYTFIAIIFGFYIYKKSISHVIKKILIFMFKILHFKV